MPWMELSLDTTAEAVDWVCALLAATPALIDVVVTPYATPATELQRGAGHPEWAFTITFWLPYQAQIRAQAADIERQLAGLHRTGLTTSLKWRVVAQAGTTAADSAGIQRIGRFVILPPAVDYQPQGDEISLKLKPGFSFGSGLHPATRLSLHLLERYVQPQMQVLDLGSGSGILSVAMARLGAQVVAIDNDPVAVAATQAAVEQNGMESQITVRAGSLGRGSELGHWLGRETIASTPPLQPAASFDLIVANVLGRIHLTLAPDFQQALRSSANQPGLLITAGFTVEYEADIDAALTTVGLEAMDCRRSQEWVALVHQLKSYY